MPGAPKTEQRFEPHGTVTRADFLATLYNLMEVNNVSNLSFTIPESAGVPAVAGAGDTTGSADGTQPSDDGAAASDVVSTDGSDDVDSQADASSDSSDSDDDYPEFLPQEDDLLPIPGDEVQAGTQVQEPVPESLDSTAGATLFKIFIPIILIVIAIVLIVLRRKKH